MSQFLEQFMILRHYFSAQYLANKFPNREALEAWQDKKVKAHLRKVLQQSDFYKHYYQGCQLSDWQSFPIIDKNLMMAHFDTLNTVKITREEAFKMALTAEETRNFKPMVGHITVGLSSGTSGHRGLFLVSREERLKWAGHALRALPGSIFKGHRIAFFLRANSNLYTSVGSRRIQFQFFDLFKPVDEHIIRLNEYQPTVLVAPPSMLGFIGQAMNAGQLTLKLEKIISVAEVLEPFDRLWLENTYGQNIHQVYQCTEGFLGSTCQYGTLHLNEDLLVVQKEYLNKSQRKFTPIITDFSRLAQPIIRYQLNDVLTERQESCPCGSIFTALEFVDGRCDDLFYLPSTQSSKIIPIFPDAIRKAILQVPVSIHDYQILQLNLNTFSVGLAGKVSLDEEQSFRASLTAVCEQHQCIPPVIQFRPYQQPEVGAKKRRLQRLFAIEAAV
jgi:putative adenylate-forming enzyme